MQLYFHRLHDIEDLTMLKLITTLFRGASAAAEEQLADRHALLLLDQQLRDAAAAVDRSKKALAIATAQEAEEARRLDDTLARIADLEERVAGALAANRDALATRSRPRAPRRSPRWRPIATP
jgi:phage shock protein A